MLVFIHVLLKCQTFECSSRLFCIVYIAVNIFMMNMQVNVKWINYVTL